MSDMLERARRIVAGEFVPENVKTSKRQWAQALLAEHDARVAAERERDQWHGSYESADDRAKVAVIRAEAAEARAEQAERERDAAARFGESTQDWLRSRVADLEAALQEKVVALRKWGYHRLDCSGYFAGEGNCDCGWDDYSVLLFAGGSDES